VSVSQSITSFFESTPDAAPPRRAERATTAPHAIVATPRFNGAHAEEIAIICHELRNSLAVVRGAARLLRSPAARDGIAARSLIERHVGQRSGHREALLEPRRGSEPDLGLQLSSIDLRVIAGYAADAIAADM